jgi:hypothetical protein
LVRSVAWRFQDLAQLFDRAGKFRVTEGLYPRQVYEKSSPVKNIAELRENVSAILAIHWNSI